MKMVHVKRIDVAIYILAVDSVNRFYHHELLAVYQSLIIRTYTKLSYYAFYDF